MPNEIRHPSPAWEKSNGDTQWILKFSDLFTLVVIDTGHNILGQIIKEPDSKHPTGRTEVSTCFPKQNNQTTDWKAIAAQDILDWTRRSMDDIIDKYRRAYLDLINSETFQQMTPLP